MHRIKPLVFSVLLFLFIVSTTCADPSEEPSPVDRPASAVFRKPKPGDKLVYSKEESVRRLDPAVRELLDALLRLYRELGLFTDRRLALSVIGAQIAQRRWHSRYDNMPDQEPMHFEDVFAKAGLFARPGWTGIFHYGGWQNKGKKWFAKIDVFVDTKIECIDSRAVEGYLDLYLQPGLRTGFDPTPRELWNRHGIFSRPYALAVDPLAPDIGMVFSYGCLYSIGVYQVFDYTEVSDEHVID